MKADWKKRREADSAKQIELASKPYPLVKRGPRKGLMYLRDIKKALRLSPSGEKLSSELVDGRLEITKTYRYDNSVIKKRLNRFVPEIEFRTQGGKRIANNRLRPGNIMHIRQRNSGRVFEFKLRKEDILEGRANKGWDRFLLRNLNLTYVQQFGFFSASGFADGSDFSDDAEDGDFFEE